MWFARLQRLLPAHSKRPNQRSKAWKPRRFMLEPLEDRVTPTALNLYGSLLVRNTLGIDVTANGGIYANLNGIITTADPGVYDSINYFPGILGDTLSVYNTNVPFSIE